MKTTVKSSPPGARQPVQRKVAPLRVFLQPCEEGGFTATCAQVPGAISEGETEEEAVENLMDAVKCVLEVTKEMTAERLLSYRSHRGKNAAPLKPKLKELCEAR
jgi:predicted RNase H-like HicB family nuclease